MKIVVKTTTKDIKISPPKTAREAINIIIQELGYKMKGGLYSICREDGSDVNDNEELDVYTTYVFIDWGDAV